MSFLRVETTSQTMIRVSTVTSRFYCDSSSDFDEHHRTHASSPAVAAAAALLVPVPSPASLSFESMLKSTKLSQTNNDKSHKNKIHRCRHCSFVSNVKVRVCSIIFH
jgi:hypothetical protein